MKEVDSIERYYLSNILNGGDEYYQYVGMVDDEDFSSNITREMYKAIKVFKDKNIVPDISLLYLYLEEHKKLKEDELDQVVNIFTIVYEKSTAKDMSSYVKLIKEKSVKSKLCSTLSEEISISNKDLSSEELVDNIEKKITDIKSLMDIKEMCPINEVRKKYSENFRKKYEDFKQYGVRVTGVPTGIKPLDNITSGFQRSDLIIIAGRPGMGKTSFGLSVLMNAALAGYHCAFFSLEMSSEQLIQRLISGHAKINQKLLRIGGVNEEEIQRIEVAEKLIDTLPIWLDDTPAATIQHIRNRCIALKNQGQLDIVFVDYLQIMGVSKGITIREQQISEISRGLKAIAKEFNVPVIALAQVNRNVEKSADKRPKMSDLRESGAIEQDADIIMFLYRDIVYNENTPLKEVAEVIIEKHRNGDSGTVFVQFDAKYTLFNTEIEIDQKQAKAIVSMNKLGDSKKSETKESIKKTFNKNNFPKENNSFNNDPFKKDTIEKENKDPFKKDNFLKKPTPLKTEKNDDDYLDNEDKIQIDNAELFKCLSNAPDRLYSDEEVEAYLKENNFPTLKGLRAFAEIIRYQEMNKERKVIHKNGNIYYEDTKEYISTFDEYINNYKKESIKG